MKWWESDPIFQLMLQLERAYYNGRGPGDSPLMRLCEKPWESKDELVARAWQEIIDRIDVHEVKRRLRELPLNTATRETYEKIVELREGLFSLWWNRLRRKLVDFGRTASEP
jgi:hypothetical protein